LSDNRGILNDQTQPTDASIALPPEQPQPRYLGVSLVTWVKTLVVAVLFIATFRFDLRRLWDKTNPIYGDANWGHAIVVPIIGLYYLYLNREQLRQTPVEPLLAGKFGRGRILGAIVCLVLGIVLYLFGGQLLAQSILQEPIRGAGLGLAALGVLVAALDWGIALLIFGLLVFQYGIYPGRNDWTSDTGVVITLFGVVLLLCGWKVMRIAWFPILFLMCAVPWPPLFYSKVAMPLQELAAKVAVGMLNLTGVEATQSGTKIFMSRGIGVPERSLNVAEACAGMRSLMTFISVGAAVAFLSNRPLWQRIILTLAAIPIAIFCNVMRVSGQGILDHYWSEQISEGFAHQFVGLVMLMPAFFLILGVGWVLDQVFVEEIDAGEKAAVKKPQTGIVTARRRVNLQSIKQQPSTGEGA
jgi:exosortase